MWQHFGMLSNVRLNSDIDVGNETHRKDPERVIRELPFEFDQSEIIASTGGFNQFICSEFVTG